MKQSRIKNSISTKRDWIDYWNFVFSAITTISLFVGGGVGLYKYYSMSNLQLSNNKLQTDKLLRDYDKDVYELIEKYPYLQAFFADFSAITDINERVHKEIAILLENGKNIMQKDKDLVQNWNNVPELTKMLWEPYNFHSPAKIKLRRATDLAEHILYLLHEVYDAKDKKIVTEHDYETWVPYIDDIGAHPLFLAAVCWGHSSGYISKEFAGELQKRLQANKENEEVLKVIYNEMTDSNWINKVGKRKCYTSK